MGRRRLALRQIEEKTADVSDLEDDNEPAVAPSFSLLGANTETGAPVGDGNGAQQPAAGDQAAQPEQNQQGKMDRIFQLYQDGLTPDQVLQLSYIRRRAPRRTSVRIEDEFILPRPTLRVQDLLPPLNMTIVQQVMNTSPAMVSSGKDLTSSDAPSYAALQEARASAKEFFDHPQKAPSDEVKTWQLLEECDWYQIYEEHQRNPGSEHPRLANVCWLVHECPSDALANFVWDHLLIQVIRSAIGCHVTGTNQDVSDQKNQLQELLTLLLRSPSFHALAPKDFRKKLRARNLRQIDEVVGTQLELELLNIYHRQRNSGNLSASIYSS